jgi:hypothetical protein
LAKSISSPKYFDDVHPAETVSVPSGIRQGRRRRDSTATPQVIVSRIPLAHPPLAVHRFGT